MGLETFPYDSADYLDTSEAIAAYLNDALSFGDARELAHALEVVARAQVTHGIALEAGPVRAIGEQALPSLVAVLNALGLRLAVQRVREPAEATRAVGAAGQNHGGRA